MRKRNKNEAYSKRKYASKDANWQAVDHDKKGKHVRRG